METAIHSVGWFKKMVRETGYYQFSSLFLVNAIQSHIHIYIIYIVLSGLMDSSGWLEVLVVVCGQLCIYTLWINNNK